MATTFLFYDLETSGLNPRNDRIMQFAAIRTNLQLKQIGEPFNVLVKMTDDILPQPEAVMVTGITPQSTLADGITEKEFCDLLIKDVFVPETITVGFNNVRFDDEFIRNTLWRNFYDPYEWAWSEGRSRWDLLDVVRMTRALRPGDIKWPVNDEGKPVNKLELIAKENSLVHSKAHDAESDVIALIDVARMIKSQQPKLFEYLLNIRDKKKVEQLANLVTPEPFVYTSGKYGHEFDFTTVALPICQGSKPGSIVVFDLRHDPDQFRTLSSEDVKRRLFGTSEERGDDSRLPLKELSYNKCPAVAPLGVFDETAQKQLHLSLSAISNHVKKLKNSADFLYKIREAYKTRPPYTTQGDVESKLYDGFLNNKDQGKVAAVRSSTAGELSDFHPEFIDERLPELLLRYKARQFPISLSESEQTAWEVYRSDKLAAALPKYLSDLQRLSESAADTYLLEELQLWAESIAPTNDL